MGDLPVATSPMTGSPPPSQQPLASCIGSLSLGGGGRLDVLLEAQHTGATFSLQFSQLCITALTTAHWSKKLLWSRLQEVLIYGDKYRYLENSVNMPSVWHRHSSRSPPKVHATCLSFFGQAYGARHAISSCGVDCKSNQKAVTPVTFMLLLHQWAYLAWHVSCGRHGVGLLMSLLPQKLA